uniref:Uncharacterized protein n=1 Tax=Ornithorhynchus anatinus TaxID=9258 RepID=A0A6I8NXQ2_ORNAN
MGLSVVVIYSPKRSVQCFAHSKPTEHGPGRPTVLGSSPSSATCLLCDLGHVAALGLSSLLCKVRPRGPRGTTLPTLYLPLRLAHSKHLTNTVSDNNNKSDRTKEPAREGGREGGLVGGQAGLLTASLMILVMTALGRFKSSGFSAMASLLEPGREMRRGAAGADPARARAPSSLAALRSLPPSLPPRPIGGRSGCRRPGGGRPLARLPSSPTSSRPVPSRPARGGGAGVKMGCRRRGRGRSQPPSSPGFPRLMEAMAEVDVSRWDESTCGCNLCQHPHCWETRHRIARGRPRLLREQPSLGRFLTENEDELPTLTITNFPSYCFLAKGVSRPTFSALNLFKSHPFFSFLSENLEQNKLNYYLEGSLEDVHFPKYNSPKDSLVFYAHQHAMHPAAQLTVQSLNETALPKSLDTGNLVVVWVPNVQQKNQKLGSQMASE